MLLQVVALLGLGVLGSSAPLQAAGPTGSRGDPLQQERSRTLTIIGELLKDLKKLSSNAVPSVVMVNATVERCMSSHLKTFISTLDTLNIHGKVISRKLSRASTYKNILPEDLDKDCRTAQISWDDFQSTLDRFLRLLSEKIQSA